MVQNELESQELAHEKKRVADYQKENKELLHTINQYLDQERHRRYVLAEPVITREQAEYQIKELLEQTEQE
ncbi:MAG: hypothetical protein NY202_03035 [Mollicutes bacterium UO1]